MWSHPEIPCILWKRLYCSSKNVLCHGLGFNVKVVCLVVWVLYYSVQLRFFTDLWFSFSSFLFCVSTCVYVCIPWNTFSSVFFFLSFLFEESRDQVLFNDWVGRRKGNLKCWPLKHRRSKSYLVLFCFVAKSIIECLCSYGGPFIV